MENKAVPMLVQPSRPTPYEVIPLTHGSVMAGLNTLVSTHVLVFKPSKELGGARPADIMKSGLAQVLVPYYPLAGRIVENETGWEVQCDGQGAVFIVTAAPDFEEVVVHQRPLNFEEAFPTETFVLPPPDTESSPPSPTPRPPTTQAPTLTVQITELASGGFILSIKLCKGLCDEAGLIHFLCGWAEMARGKPHVSVLPVWGDKKTHLGPLPYSSIDYDARYQPSRHGTPITIDDNTRYQVHLPNLEQAMQDSELYGQEQDILSCPLHSNAYRPSATTERIKLDIPFEVIKALVDWLHVEESCPCSVAQVVAAHVWRERTRALHIPDNANARLFFISKPEENYPTSFYGAFAFNCQAKARASDLVVSPLSYAVKLIQEAEENLLTNFKDCTNDFKLLHCSCGYTPPEVLLFTNLPTNNLDKHLDFGVLGKPLPPSSDIITFPSNVNIVALAPPSHSYDSTVHLIINNVPFVHVNDLRSHIHNLPLFMSKDSRM
eukprot:c3473_g1_i1 orf=3-1481(-)